MKKDHEFIGTEDKSERWKKFILKLAENATTFQPDWTKSYPDNFTDSRALVTSSCKSMTGCKAHVEKSSVSPKSK